MHISEDLFIKLLCVAKTYADASLLPLSLGNCPVLDHLLSRSEPADPGNQVVRRLENTLDKQANDNMKALVNEGDAFLVSTVKEANTTLHLIQSMR